MVAAVAVALVLTTQDHLRVALAHRASSVFGSTHRVYNNDNGLWRINMKFALLICFVLLTVLLIAPATSIDATCDGHSSCHTPTSTRIIKNTPMPYPTLNCSTPSWACDVHRTGTPPVCIPITFCAPNGGCQTELYCGPTFTPTP